MKRPSRQPNDRGAIIIHVAIALLALIAFSAFVVDAGAMWVARRQAQNAADAGALAGAVALMQDGSDRTEAGKSAFQWAGSNLIWGVGNTTDNVEVTFSGPAGTCGTSCTIDTIPPCGSNPGCVRVDVFRNMPDRAGAVRGGTIPTFFAPMVGINEQGVRATATAQVGAGNQIQCLLPFAVIDRFADNFDTNNHSSFWPNDLQPAGAGWTSTDQYQPSASIGQNGGCNSAPNLVTGASQPCDSYSPPYNNNPNHTGWRVAVDFGRQLILKGGSPNQQTYSTGWSNLVYLPGSTGANDVGDDIRGCNERPVGIARQENTCPVTDEPNGCVSVKPGVSQGPISSAIDWLYGQDSAARWDWSAPGPNGPTAGGVVGGQGMASPRIRPLVVVEIDHYNAQGCGGAGCIAKVANIIGFFVEGMCNDVMTRKPGMGGLDPGMTCDDPTKQVVGRIVTVPGVFAAGGTTGTVDESASFVQVIRLVR